jgi:hypothetical protein
MTGWLKLTNEQRRETLSQAQARSGIIVKSLEKDWWVTLTLKALFQSAYGQHMVFKGGTSLSKGWKLIARFSEDIDIALDPQAFGMAYEENPKNKYVNELKRQGCAFTSNLLRGELNAQFAALGVPDGMILIEAEPVPPTRPDTDPQTLHIKYPSLYEPNPYIADEVKIEVSVRSLQVPFTGRPILSILSEVFPNPSYQEAPFNVNIVEPRKTFLEKTFLLHEEFGKPDKARIRYERMSRHFYDLVMNMDNGVGEAALADHDLYERLIRHRQVYSRISWVDYASLGHATLSFLPPAEMLELYRNDYATMQEHMIYEKAPPFDDIIVKLKLLQGRFRLKKDSRSLGEILDRARTQATSLEGEAVSVIVDNITARYRVDFIRKNQNLLFENITSLPG